MLLSSHLGTAPCSGCHGRFFPPSSAPVHTTSGIGECLVEFAHNASCELVLAISPRNPPQGTSQPSGAPERFSYCNGLWYSNRFQAHLQHIANSIYQWPTTCKNSRAKSCFCQATSAPHLVADATGVFFPPSLAPVHSTSGIGEWPVASAQHASCELVLAISPRNPPQGASQLSGAPKDFRTAMGPSIAIA